MSLQRIVKSRTSETCVVEITIAELKKYKSPGSEFPAEQIQSGGGILLSAIHKLINSVWNKKELPNQ
jgi:hypothetical protein